MNFKGIFFTDGESTTPTVRKRKKQAEEINAYGKLLGLNKSFKFEVTRKKVTNDTEFTEVVDGAEKLLKQDFKRFGQSFELIPAGLKNKLAGNIGSMTILVDDDGKVAVKFHKRDADFLWDGETKKFPESAAEGKYKHEIFFDLDDDEEE